MNAKNKQLAFMQGIQNKDIQIQGNPALVIWFQGLTKYLVPKKKAAAKRLPDPHSAASSLVGARCFR